MAVGEADGGWGASLLDLCLVAEQHGRCLTPVPMVEAQVAARLLAGLGGDDASSRLKGMLAGGRLVTTAILPERDGKLLAVPGGAVADEVLFLGNDAVMILELSDSNRRFTANIGCLPLADIETEGARPLGWGAPAMRAFDRAVDDWMILTAGAMVGLASRALEIGATTPATGTSSAHPSGRSREWLTRWRTAPRPSTVLGCCATRRPGQRARTRWKRGGVRKCPYGSQAGPRRTQPGAASMCMGGTGL